MGLFKIQSEGLPATKGKNSAPCRSRNPNNNRMIIKGKGIVVARDLILKRKKEMEIRESWPCYGNSEN